MPTVFVLTFTDDIGSIGTVPAGVGSTVAAAQAEATLFLEANLPGCEVEETWDWDEDDWGSYAHARVVDSRGRRDGLMEIREFEIREG